MLRVLFKVLLVVAIVLGGEVLTNVIGSLPTTLLLFGILLAILAEWSYGRFVHIVEGIDEENTLEHL